MTIFEIVSNLKCKLPWIEWYRFWVRKSTVPQVGGHWGKSIWSRAINIHEQINLFVVISKAVQLFIICHQVIISFPKYRESSRFWWFLVKVSKCIKLIESEMQASSAQMLSCCGFKPMISIWDFENTIWQKIAFKNRNKMNFLTYYSFSLGTFSN